MGLGKMLKQKLVCCKPDTSVRDAAALMDDFDVGAVLVVENERPVGMITDRDIVVRCVVQGGECTKLLVRDVMTEPVECVTADSGIAEAARRMRECRVRRLPVVDAEGRAVGLVSFDDLLQLLGREIVDLTETAEPLETKLADRAA